MNNNFEMLKQETSELIKNNITYNEKSVISFLNTILEKFNSNLSVRKNMSIKSFETLLINSASAEEFKTNLDKLDTNKDYHICDLEMLNEDIEFNEEHKNDNIEEYEQYKKFLDTRVKLNDNLYIIEYPKN